MVIQKNPELGNGIPRCELYLYVDNIQFEFDNAIKSGAKLISPIIEVMMYRVYEKKDSEIRYDHNKWNHR